MKSFKIVPAIAEYSDFAAFAKEINLGPTDLILTNEYIYEPTIAALNLGCHTCFQEKFGGGEPTDIMVDAILDSLRGRDEGILGEEVVFTHLLTVEMLRPVVIFYFTSELRLKFLGIKMSNRRGAANSFFEIGKNSAILLPSGLMVPIPVTTTRLSVINLRLLRFAGWKNRKLFLVCLDIGDSVANGSDLLCILVRDLDIESLLKFHDQLNGVE